jgi:hypothetical protein
MVELFSATNEPNVMKKWQAARTKHATAPLPVAPPPREKK